MTHKSEQSTKKQGKGGDGVVKEAEQVS